MVENHLVLAVVWIVYCLLHSVLASVALKKRVHSFLGENFRYYRLFYTLFAALSLAAVVAFQFSMQSAGLFSSSIGSYAAGGLVALAGLVIMGICIKKYFVSLSGLKTLVHETAKAELMINGIHRYMRHPLYTGTFLTIWGAWIIFPTYSLLISNFIITAYTLYAIRLEEQKLVAEFGEAYQRYQQTVPGLIPRF